MNGHYCKGIGCRMVSRELGGKTGTISCETFPPDLCFRIEFVGFGVMRVRVQGLLLNLNL